ncbi:MAG: zinc-ribbon domain-containing protein [Syntrophomonadaceae bacterium]|jgi:hypothetical protein
MGKFCTKCSASLNGDAKFCTKCGANVFQMNEPMQISTGQYTAQSEQEISKTICRTKEKPVTAGDSADSSSRSPMGAGKFITEYIRQSLTVLKNPKQMLPTALLGLVWLVLALLGSFGINSLPVRILSFLTFAQGGMFGGVIGAAGGILGKVVVAAFLNVTIVPLFQKKAPFAEIGNGFKGFFGMLAVNSMSAVFPLLSGVGVSLLLYAFMNTTQSLQNSMVGIIAFVILLQNIGRQGGFLWGLIFSVANSISKGTTPSYIEASRFIGGMTLGFALGVALSAMGLLWCVWIGAVLLIVALIFAILSKSKKEVAAT